MRKFTKIASLIMAIAIVASTLIIFPVTNTHVHAETSSPSAGVFSYSLSGNDFGKETSPYSLMWAPTVGSVYGYDTANIKAVQYSASTQTYVTDEATPRTMFSKHTDGRLVVHAIGDNAGNDKSAYKSPTVKFTAPMAGSYTFTWNVQRLGGNSGTNINIHLGSWSFDDSTKVATSDTNLYTKTKTVNLTSGQSIYFYMSTTASNNEEVRTAFDVTATVTLANDTKFTPNFSNTPGALNLGPYFNMYQDPGKDLVDLKKLTTISNTTVASDGKWYYYDGQTSNAIAWGPTNNAMYVAGLGSGHNTYNVVEFVAPTAGLYQTYVYGDTWGGGETTVEAFKNVKDNKIGEAKIKQARGSLEAKTFLNAGDKLYITFCGLGDNMSVYNFGVFFRSATCSHTGGTATCVEQATCDWCGNKYGAVSTTNHVENEATEYYDLGNGTHGQRYVQCQLPTTFTPEAHKGGTATCLAEAVCSVCNVSYGNKANHTVKYKDLTATHHTEYCDFTGCTHEEDPATHTWNNGACSVCNYQCQHDFTGGGACTFGCGTDHQHTGGTATCESPAICDVCSQPYGAKDMSNHTSDTVVYTSWDENGHVAALKCCGTVIPENTAHVYDADGLCACTYQCAHPTDKLTEANCVDPSTCQICNKVMAEKDADNHKSTELEWTKTETHHSAVHSCCKTEAVAEAEHTLDKGKCTVCDKVIENALGTEYVFDLSDLGSETDKYDFFTATNNNLSDLTKLTKVIIAKDNGGWGFSGSGADSGTGIVKPSDTLNNYFFIRQNEPAVLQAKAFNGAHQVIAFKAPVNGVYTFSFKAHVWGNANQLLARVIRKGETTPRFSFSLADTTASNATVRTGSVELAAGEYLYFDFCANSTAVQNYIGVSAFSVTLTEKLNKAPDKIVDIHTTLGAITGLPVKDFAFYTASGLIGPNYSGTLMNNKRKLTPLVATVLADIGVNFKGHYLLTEADSNKTRFDISSSDHKIVSSIDGLGLVIKATAGEVQVITYTVPADGKYSYTLNGRDTSNASGGIILDVNVNGTNSWWDNMFFRGVDHADYKGAQTSSQKTLKKGDVLYFIFRVDNNEPTTYASITEFTITQHGKRVPATGDDTAAYVISALVLISGAALVIGKKRRRIEK